VDVADGAVLRVVSARRLPWWLVLLFGVAAVVVGVWLTAEPFRSLSVLVVLVVAGLLLTGAGEIAAAGWLRWPWVGWLVGAVWIVAGVVAVAWPGLTVWGLAITVGVGLIVGGIGELADAMLAGGVERLIAGVSGDASVVIGVLALRWPAVTVLVIAVLFGIRTVLFGLALVVAAFGLRGGAVPGRARRWRWPWRVRLVGAVAASVLAVGGVAASVAIHRAAPEAPGAFYRPPSRLPADPPGTISEDRAAGLCWSRPLISRAGWRRVPHGRPGRVGNYQPGRSTSASW